jgi:hypothetical protein
MSWHVGESAANYKQVIHLQMNLKKKLGIIAIFTIGVL